MPRQRTKKRACRIGTLIPLKHIGKKKPAKLPAFLFLVFTDAANAVSAFSAETFKQKIVIAPATETDSISFFVKGCYSAVHTADC